MTCIVAVIDQNGTITMAGDSAGVAAGYSLTTRNDVKVFRNGEFVLGFTSSFRMGQLLHYSFRPPPITEDLDAYMVTSFVDALRQCFKDGGYASKIHEEEAGGCFLVGVRGRIFLIGSDYQVGESRLPFNAVGCGSDIALGALFISMGQAGVARVALALCAAETFSAGVRGPFTVEVLAPHQPISVELSPAVPEELG